MKLRIKSLKDLKMKTVSESSFKKNKYMDDDGLFSEVIFGPMKSYKCKCKNPQYLKEGDECPKCGVKYISNLSRRYINGKIDLPFKMIHPFLFDKIFKLSSLKELKVIILNLFKGICYKKITDNDRIKLSECPKEEAEYIYFDKLHEIIEILYEKDNNIICKFIYENRNNIIINNIIVIPPDIRPFKDEKFLDDLNKYYALIISYCKIVEQSPFYIDSNTYNNIVPEKIMYSFMFKLQLKIQELYNYCIQKLGKKTGLLRGNMLGKRVDFSGRSVIIVDPIIPLTHCGLPYIMLLELFKLKLANMLTEKNEYVSIQQCIDDIDTHIENVDYEKFKKYIDEIVEDEWVILNRQPSLHRLSMMAFKIKPVDGFCISINPLITPPFGADFDGDQMAVYVVLYKESKIECEEKLWSIKQLLNPANGEIVFTPNQDVVLGVYQLTRNDLNIKEHKEKVIFKDKEISLGRYIFNNVLPKDYPLLDSTINKKKLMNILSDIVINYKNSNVYEIYDNIKKLGFKYSTIYPITLKFSSFDMNITNDFKIKNIFNDSNKYKNYLNENELLNTLKTKFLYKDLIESGSRGNWNQAKQLFLSRGYIADMNNKVLDEPIISSNFEGLTQKEYFNSCYGTRKGLIDTAENTSKSGYLTRTLVYALSGLELDLFTNDCGTNKTLDVFVKDESKLSALINRYMVENGQLKLITKNDKYLIGKNIKLRSPIGCLDRKGICKTCFGELNEIFRSRYLGIISAQSLGEVSTQMVLRTFHLSGLATIGSDKGEQSDIISDVKKLFKLLLYTKNEYYSSESELIEYIYNVYKNYSNILYIHFETLISQMLWYEKDSGIFTKLRLVNNIDRENIRFISCKDVPIYESWFLGCLYSNVSKNLLRGIIENKPYENILTRICIGNI